MTLPHDASRLAAITDWTAWRTALERNLASLDARLVSRGTTSGFARRVSYAVAPEPVTSGEAGAVFIWLGTAPPAGTLTVTGQVLDQGDHPYLYAVVGDQHTQPADPPGTFRLPDLGSPPAGMYVVRT